MNSPGVDLCGCQPAVYRTVDEIIVGLLESCFQESKVNLNPGTKTG